MSGVSGLKIFRLNPPERWVITPIVAIILVAVGMSWTRSDLMPDRIIGALVVAGAVAGACWLMLRVRVVLSPERLEITNLRSHAIPYSEIIAYKVSESELRREVTSPSPCRNRIFRRSWVGKPEPTGSPTKSG